MGRRRRRALEAPGTSLRLASFLVEYQFRRNEVAQQSHARTRMARHKGGKLRPP
jgi:hypothetical protein